MKHKLVELYNELLKKHGFQGWWPINKKYFLKEYDRPLNDLEKFEIILGKILTQNTNWKNAEKALDSLRSENYINPSKLLIMSHESLANLIKSSGYYNQKAIKLKKISEFILKNNNPTRDQLLNIYGIGEETADSILLYVFIQPYFVIDTYTKRLLKNRLNICFRPYKEYQDFFHFNLPKDTKLFNEYHALIVAEGKITS